MCCSRKKPTFAAVVELSNRSAYLITASRSKKLTASNDRQSSSQPPPSSGRASTSTMVRSSVVTRASRPARSTVVT